MVNQEEGETEPKPLLVQLETVEAAGQERWPDVRVPQAALRDHLEAWRTLSEAAKQPSVDLAEVYLAIGCSVDAPGAMQAFEQRYVESALGALRSFRLDRDALDEVLQRTRVRLCVAQPPQTVAPIVRYAGLGRLGGLVRVTLVREAQRLRGADSRAIGDFHEALATDLPEHTFVRQQHQDLLKTATAAAAQRLDVRARTLLRLHYSRGVSGSNIARMYNVHRSTAVRWLASARQRLLDEVCAELKIHAPEFVAARGPALRELVHSQLDLSLSRIFGRT